MRGKLEVMWCTLVLAFGVGTALAAEEKKEPVAAGGAPQIAAVQTFLLSWGKGKGEEAKAVATEKVPVKVGDKAFTLDCAGDKPPVAVVLPFRGLSTVREKGKVKAVTVERLRLKAGDVDKEGQATLAMEEKDGKFLVTGVALE